MGAQKLELGAAVAAHWRCWQLNSTPLQWQNVLLTPRVSFLCKGGGGVLFPPVASFWPKLYSVLRFWKTIVKLT